MIQFVPNPARPGRLRAVNITDRAKRYRAQRNAPPKSRCVYCGNPHARDVEHIDGDEGNEAAENLSWSCRGCNVTKGRHFSLMNVGTKTAQRNGGRHGRGGRRRKNSPAGAKTMKQYVSAIMVLKGQSDEMQLQDAIDLIHNTPQADRSSFARDIWSRRRARR